MAQEHSSSSNGADDGVVKGMIAGAKPRGPAVEARGERRQKWLDSMVLPSLGILAIVIGYPIVYTIVLSTQDYNLVATAPARFVEAANYRKLATDPTFRLALGNTAIYTFGSVAAAAFLGLVFALLSESLLRWHGRLARVLLLTPWAVPFVVVAFLFRYMYLQNGGAVNAVLLGAGVIDAPIPWLNASSLAMPAVMVANIWAMAPFFFLLLSAALAGIPNEVIESARIDRASVASMILRIKLPFLRNALLVGSLLMIISNFNDFAKIWAMTQEDPVTARRRS